jgi:hypothetical protein
MDMGGERENVHASPDAFACWHGQESGIFQKTKELA